VKNPTVSRRGFFQALKHGARDLLPTPEGESERQRMVDAVRLLAPQDPDRRVPGDSFASFAVNDACNACTMCDRICPTGALEFSSNETHFQLSFSTAACVNCGLCTRFCAPMALQHIGAPSIGQLIDLNPVILRKGTLIRCRKCGTRFAAKSGETLCATCAFRQKNPFGAIRNFGAAARADADTNPYPEG
jgi:formate hydrogenlyase subunit 6/NADH:ubiquinone oxidoreductase subunit I